MMRMMMGDKDRPALWTAKELYPDKEAPPIMSLATPRDFLWDRQLPFFAAEKGFDKRLGFQIEEPEELNATLIRKETSNWFKLVKQVAPIRGDAKRGALVAAEWGAFPLIIRKAHNDEFNEAADEMVKLRPYEYADQWTDIAATNTNLGNGLIGPGDIGLATASELERATEDGNAEGVRDGIRAVLNYLVDNSASIRVFDLRAKRLLLFAAELVYPIAEKAQKEKVRAFLDADGNAFRNDDYEICDPTVSFLMRQQDREANQTTRSKRAREPEKAPHFAVAGAFPRAMAVQSGWKVYFGAKHIAALARLEMDKRKAAQTGKARPSVYAREVKDLAAETQKIISHTLWQPRSER